MTPASANEVMTIGETGFADSRSAEAMGVQVARRARVVLVLPTYLPESFGGAEQQSRKLALALGGLGVAVTLLAPRLLPHTAKHEKDASISLYRFRLRSAPNLGGRHIGSLLSWGMQLFWWLTQNRDRYDVIHIIHGRLHALPAVLAGAWLGKPTLIKIGRGGAEHFDIDLVSRKRFVGAWYAKLLMKHTTGYIANSREIVADLRRWRVDPQRIHEIPNGVELPALPVDAPRRAAVRLAYVGRLEPEKSLDILLQGFAALRDKSRASLTIVGEGSCRGSLEALVAKLQIEQHVEFTGAVSDVSTALRNADVFVSTSSSEGMSNALLEAMSFGVVPLVSRVSGVEDIVEDDRSGLLFAPGDLVAFVRRLEYALALPADRRRSLSLAARAAMEQRFAIGRIAEQHVDLYQRLAEAC